MAISETATLVARNTPPHVNRKIETATHRSIEYFRTHRDEIDERLQELDREWDIERLLETNASALMLLGLGLGIGVDRRFLALPVVVSGFLLQHALQGWCPPVAVFRRMGVRTHREIEDERHALQKLGGEMTGIH
jgi:hypothetical protein